jgi:hypothetical protein
MMRVFTLFLSMLAACGPATSAPPALQTAHHPEACRITAHTGAGDRWLASETQFESGLPTRRRRYDRRGNLTREQLWWYDAAGNPVRETSREPDTSTPITWTRTRTYDTQGRWVLQRTDYGNDRVVDVETARWFHAGRLHREERTQHGDLLYVVDHTYARSGLRHEAVTAWFDGDSDLHTWDLTPGGQVQRERVDLGIDGRWDRTLTQTWENGFRRNWDEDLNGDGRPDIVGRALRTDQGHVEEEDLNGDEIPDRTRAYDHAGNLVREWFPNDDLTYKYDYECLEAQGP